jgi:hypothetical protein
VEVICGGATLSVTSELQGSPATVNALLPLLSGTASFR